jgi:hypothetical protein
MSRFNEKNDVLDRIKAKYKTDNVMPSTLRLEKKIVNGKQIFEFAMIEDNGAAEVTERRLRKNDLFIADEIGLFLINRTTAKPGIEVLQTYPNPQVFPAGTTFLASDLEVLYNSQFNFTVGQKIVIEGLDTSRFRAIDALIQTSATTASSSSAEMGFIPLVPQIILNGQQTAKTEIKLPTTAGLFPQNDVAGHDNFVVLILRGFLIPQA